MTTSLTALVAAEHAADLRRAATNYSSGKADAPSPPPRVALRQAEADDAPGLRMLAELDEAPKLAGEALIALIEGEVVAAISLDDGRVLANPFVASSDAVALLKLRAHQLRDRGARPRRRRWRSRFA
jgi:hypothetical protein